MIQLLRMTNEPLQSPLTLVAGSEFRFKISGLGPDRRHVRLVSDSLDVQAVVLKADDGNSEQTLKLVVGQRVSPGQTVGINAYRASNSSERVETTPSLAVVLQPRLELPNKISDEAIVVYMLLAENNNPDTPGYSRREVQEAMRCMVSVFENRLGFGPSHFGGDVSTTTVKQLIMAKGQVQGFERWPTVGVGQQRLIDELLRRANDPSNRRFIEHRQHVQDALDVARGYVTGMPACRRTDLYGWMTGTSSENPGRSFEQVTVFGGQKFYALSEAFQRSNRR